MENVDMDSSLSKKVEEFLESRKYSNNLREILTLLEVRADMLPPFCRFWNYYSAR